MRPGATGPLLLTLASAVTTLCAFPLLNPLFSASHWWGGPALGVGAVTAVGAAAPWARIPNPLHPILQGLALAVAVTVYYAPGTALFGVIPTKASVDRIQTLILLGLNVIETSTTPLPVTSGLTLLVTLGVGLLAILIHLVAVTLRLAGLAGLALLALMFVPLTVHGGGISWGAFTLAGLGFLLLLCVESIVRARDWGIQVRSDRWRTSERRSALAGPLRQALAVAPIAAVTMALALLLPPLAPGLSDDALFGLTSGVRTNGETVTTVNPLASLRRDLTSLSDRRILEYRTPQSRPEYLRTHVLDAFDGADWTMSPVQASQRSRLSGELPPAPGADPESEPVTVEITVSANVQRMDFLPLPYPSSSVRVPGDWFVDPDTLMVFSPRGEAGGLTYQVVTSRVAPSPSELSATVLNGPTTVEERYLALPSISAEVAQLTESIVEDAGTPHERAVALQSWFADGDFEYTLRPQGVPDGVDPLAHFLLDGKSGYCQHFSAAMAVMARHSGIPARVAVGYTAGEHVGDDRWVVTERDGHAWPELYFEGRGWLRFEPTPSSRQGQQSASVPDYSLSAPLFPLPDGGRDSADPPEGLARPSPGSEAADSEATESETSPAPAEADPEDGAVERTGVETIGVGAAVAITAAVLVVLLLGPALARRLVRWLRWGRAEDAPGRARAAWLELRDDLLDLGLEWNLAESPRALGRRLETDHRLPEHARTALRRIVAAVEAARYAPEPISAHGLGSDSRAVRIALAAAHPPRARMLALLLPRSLFTPARSRRESTKPL